MARYELLERIGLGGMAEVFRGVAVAGGGFEKPVAIKRILPHLSQDQRFVRLLISEAKILSELRHRNVVQIYDVGLGDDGQYFLVMEFVDGIDLGALYTSVIDERRQRLPLELALFVCAEICEALDHAHRARSPEGRPLGLVHRDVSPSNVMLSRSGEVKLTDFGIAKRMEEATGHGGVRGKFAYISPEQARNEHVDARSDIYCIGILLFEMALGRRLYSGMPDFDALKAVRANQVPRPRDVDPNIDPRLEALINQALAADPAQRFESAGRFGAELRNMRYTLDDAVGDPAVAIADLVSRYGDSERRREASPDPEIEERTVVRIDTAAGFSIASIRQAEAALADNHDPTIDIDSATQDALLDEETRAMSVEQLQAAIGGARVADSVPPPVVKSERAASPGEDTDARTRIAPFNVASIRSGVDDRTRVDDDVTDEPPTREESLDEATDAWTPMAAANLRRLAPAPAPQGNLLSRAAAPAAPEVFHAGPIAAAPLPGATSAPSSPRPHFLPASRRVTFAVAVVLAVVAFAVVGHLMASDEPADGSSAAVDAGPPDAGVPDAAATLLMPPDEVEVSDPDDRRKRRRDKKRRRDRKRDRDRRNR